MQPPRDTLESFHAKQGGIHDCNRPLQGSSMALAAGTKCLFSQSQPAFYPHAVFFNPMIPQRTTGWRYLRSSAMLHGSEW